MSRIFRNVTSVLIFFIQGSMVVMFFYSLGSTWWENSLLAGLGIVLELAKRLSWIEVARSVAKGLRTAQITALTLCVVSGLASVAFAYNSIQTGTEALVVTMQERAILQEGLTGLQTEAFTIRSKLVALPDDWVTSSMKYSDRLDEISRMRATIMSRLGQMSASGSMGQGSMALRDFAKESGLSYSVILLFLLGVIAVAMEIATYNMIGGGHQHVLPPIGRDARVLEASFQGPGKPLLGRRKVAAKLGLDQNEVRTTLARLAALGLVVVPPGRRAYRMKVAVSDALERLVQLE